MRSFNSWTLALGLAVFALSLAADSHASRRRAEHEPIGHQTFTSPQSNPIVVSEDGAWVFAASTTSNRVDVIQASKLRPFSYVEVGVDPVSLAIRPGAHELWVSNHISDSVSVVDIDPGSETYLHVIHTIQRVDQDAISEFDEPVGIAFTEDGAKAYVALSSRNQIAVINANSYAVTHFLNIPAQDPRAIAVRKLGPAPSDPELLFVAAFESDNLTELSMCSSKLGTDQCSLGVGDILNFALNPLLIGEIRNIVADSDRPDRDLFVFDTSLDTPILSSPITGVGTLLYGMAVDSQGKVFVSQTDARNAINGIESSDVNSDGVANLADLENRTFLNQISRVDCGGALCSSLPRFDLDAPVGTTPGAGSQLATPYGIALTADDSLLLITAAASSRIASLRADDGAILDRLDVGAIPRGIALHDNGDGTHRAYVLNTLGNSVHAVDVDGASGALSLAPTHPARPQPIEIGADPTPDAVRLGRIAFNNASASTQGTFSCASCHPDGHTDQLLWRIGGECFQPGCIPGQDEPRTTMPVRGLRDTLPLHWDGVLGDPFGGANGSGGSPGSNCDGSNPETCFRHLVDASLSGVMCEQPCAASGELSENERDNMAAFLESVSYPPARSRRPDDWVTNDAISGFDDFFTDKGGISVSGARTCADATGGCHQLPLGAATNSFVGNFDAPTMRGMTDRFIHFSLGTGGSEEMLQAATSWNPATQGMDEATTFAADFTFLFSQVYGVGPDDIFQMFEEASTGHSGAFGRQVTFSQDSSTGCPACGLWLTLSLLEDADERGVVNLQGTGTRDGDYVRISYLADEGAYRVGASDPTVTRSRAQLIAEAHAGTLVATLTAHLRENISEHTPQPLLSVPGANCNTGGFFATPILPFLSLGDSEMDLESKYIGTSDAVFVDGENWTQLHGANISPRLAPPPCGTDSITPDSIEVDLKVRPSSGAHLLQLQATDGLLSNELLFFVQ